MKGTVLSFLISFKKMINSEKISKSKYSFPEEKNKREYGSLGEIIAYDYLIKNNFKILKQNYRYGRLGEIDIIALENDYVCFIEVKTRSSTLFGTPAEAVNYKKQNKIKKLAQIFLKENNLSDKPLRFDILEIILEYNKYRRSNKVKYINLIRNAF